ncbi:MAG: SusD/RagB family nutrient-binding outer membrane lipoprotein [Muribaculaceae bacterium]|nr:SusD/RagB family nutrient-binding outer membrane lipoprotein [Muribaculaceae bacterium]
MKKFIIPSMILAIAGFTSCNDYLDINSNPNSPDEASLTNDLIYPGVEMAYVAITGNYLRSCAGYLSEFYAQQFGTSNYVPFSQFEASQERTSYFYQYLYLRVLSNANIVKGKAEAEGDWATYLAATVMSAATFQDLVDMYGETPYTEALDAENPMPNYDKGDVVYAGILNDLDEAIQKAKADPKQLTATSFLIPNGAAEDWIQVANALKLRILMREHNVVNVSSQLASLIQENNFPASDIEWAGCWSNASEKANPFYSEEFADWGAQKNAILNCALQITMSAYNDGRLPVYFTRSQYDGQFHGSVSGDNMSSAVAPYSSTTYWSRPNMAYNTPVSFISRAEIEFWLAEYYADNGDMTNGANHYQAAIEASFASAGVDGAADAIAAWPFTANTWKESLGVQKWVLFGCINTFQGWCELRRLKYPAFDTAITGTDMYSGKSNCNVDTSLLSPGHIYTPYKVYAEVGDNHVVQRFPYSSASENRNEHVGEGTENEFPGFLAPIFWAE